MTDREKLEKIREELVSSEVKSYARMKKENVLEKLYIAANNKTGDLTNLIFIPLYEHDVEFLDKVLKEVGYTPSYSEEYNHFYERWCYKVTL